MYVIVVTGCPASLKPNFLMRDAKAVSQMRLHKDLLNTGIGRQNLKRHTRAGLFYAVTVPNV